MFKADTPAAAVKAPAAVAATAKPSSACVMAAPPKPPTATEPVGPVFPRMSKERLAVIRLLSPCPSLNILPHLYLTFSYNDFVISHEALLERYSEIHGMEETKEMLFRNCDVLLHEHSQSYMLLSCLEDEVTR